MYAIQIDERWCKGCTLCVISCPTRALRMAGRFSVRGVHPPELALVERCNGCRLCELLCPDFAITVTEACCVQR
ncbi:MAG: 4Fe-4S binding protein [Chloroflexi bacterium]|nr:4Fe-4S binding protein [Chloroflexota bacterium]